MTAGHAPPLWQLLQVVAPVVAGVRGGQSLGTLLDAVPAPSRSGAQALSFEVLRQLGVANAIARLLAPRRPAPLVDALLCSAIALALPGRAQPYEPFTLVNQSVEAAKRTAGTRGQAAFLNACLRRLLREPEAWLARVQDDPVARWNYPLWWIRRLQRDHPADWQTILEAGQHAAPMDLRVNRGRISVAQYQAQLELAGIAGVALGGAALRLERPRPVRELPGFDAGLVSVQSATAQRAAPLLLDGLEAAAPRVLDACAAPGGKTAHLLEHCPQAQVTALELDAARAGRIRENLARLGLEAEVRVADAGDPASWWQGERCDAILLDAPCSASGIVRRHPDVRWLRREGDVTRLAGEQDRLLAALWPLLAEGGRLLYVTCSVFRQEGSERIDAFLARNSDARQCAAPGHLLPGSGLGQGCVGDNVGCDEDGFFYALLEKRLA